MNPLAMLGLWIIAGVAVYRTVAMMNEGTVQMMGGRVLPFDLFLPAKIPKAAPI